MILRLPFTLVIAAILSFAAKTEAIILYRTADPNANTAEPTGELAGSGWQYQGVYGEFLGTVIGPRFFITARHLGGAGTNKFVYRGKDYAIVRFFEDTASDLRINEVAETFPAYAPLYTKGDEVGKRLVMIGRGTRRGTERIVNGQLRGWEYGPSDHVQRWGENIVAAIVQRGGETLQGLFDGPGLPNEGHYSAGDSGGAVFINDGGVWKLAGINSDVDTFASGPDGGGPYTASMFDMRGSYRSNGTLVTGDAPVPSAFYAARISSRLPWITSIIGSRLMNISARATVGTGERVSISGFIIQGNPGQSKRLIIRGLGPSLQVGDVPVAGRITNPVLELHDAAGSVISVNDNWRESQAGEIESIGFAPPDERESALIATLPVGNYTAVLRNGDGAAGTGLIEVYDLEAVSDARLANLSARAFVDGGDDVLIGGLIIRSFSKRLILRALGPSLAARGVVDELRNPVLELHDSNGALLSANDNWNDASNRSEIAATGLAPTDSRESAILTTPNLGTYTAVVRGAGGTTGVALLEAYLLN